MDYTDARPAHPAPALGEPRTTSPCFCWSQGQTITEPPAFLNTDSASRWHRTLNPHYVLALTKCPESYYLAPMVHPGSGLGDPELTLTKIPLFPYSSSGGIQG